MAEALAEQSRGLGRGPRAPAPVGRLIFVSLLSLYLLTGGGKGYSFDGNFGYEMARTAFLDPQHDYFHRFKTAFARWGALMPLLGQPFVLAGDALSRVAPERDDLVVDGHRFRVEAWPSVGAGQQATLLPPLPGAGWQQFSALALVSYLSYATDVPHGTAVGEVRLWQGNQLAALPVRAGVETAEWAHDRPDVAGTMGHGRARVAGHWIGQPRGNLYFARLTLPAPMTVDRWELAGLDGLGAQGQWSVRAVTVQDAGTREWLDVHTGTRLWLPRRTHSFFTHLIYSTLNAFTTAATAVLVYAIAGQFGYGRSTRTIAALGFGVATMAWPYAKLDFSEPASTLFVMLAVWALYRAFPPTWATAGSGESLIVPDAPAPLRSEGVRFVPAKRRAAMLGLIASLSLLLAIVGKYSAAALAAAVLGQWAVCSRWWVPRRRRPAVAFLVALVAPLTVMGLAAGIVAYKLTGETPIVLTRGTSRLTEMWLTLHLWTGLRSLLFSPGKSLFLYSPWLLLALLGAPLWLRRHPWSGAFFVVIPVAFIMIYSTKGGWHGGSWGLRYLLPIVPLCCVAAAPAIDWCLARGRSGRLALAALATVSLGVQLLAIGKDPGQYPAMVREFIAPALPDNGSNLGGRDYWLARGGDGLARALQDPDPSGRHRGLGYLWGEPDAQLTLTASAPHDFTLSLYFVDWDRQQRRQTVTVEDAAGVRRLELHRDFGHGVWASWQVTAAPERPLRISLQQEGRETAVVSAATFDPPRGGRQPQDEPVLDEQTGGDWRGRYGADGAVLFAWRNFDIDVSTLPKYLSSYEVSHMGDVPNPRIHVETAEQDVLDTPLLYAPPFSPLLGNFWLLAADGAQLVLPAHPGVVAGILARPPWTWFGVRAPSLEHPEYGLGLDFWPTALYVNYASHRQVLVAMWTVLALLNVVLLASVARLIMRLVSPAVRVRWAGMCVTGLAIALLVFDWLQVQA